VIRKRERHESVGRAVRSTTVLLGFLALLVASPDHQPAAAHPANALPAWPALGEARRTDRAVAPAAYLSHALDVLQTRDVFAGRVNWTEERRKLETLLSQRPSMSTARSLIEQAFVDLNDGHAALRPPKADSATEPEPVGAPIVPHGRMLASRVGYVLLPAVSGDPDSRAAGAYAARGEQLVKAFANRGATSWVVDLRYNTGGDVYPMLVAVAGLLPPGRVLAFQPRVGARTWVTYDLAAFYANNVKIMSSPSPEVRLRRPVVAILTSSQTASSGEATLIAFLGQPNVRTFGQPTYGVPNAPTTVNLSDGYVMEYSAESDVDRTGRLYNGPVAPDQVVAVPKNFVAGDRELHAAEQWIAGRNQQRQLWMWVAALTLVAVCLGLVLAYLGHRRSRSSRGG